MSSGSRKITTKLQDLPGWYCVIEWSKSPVSVKLGSQSPLQHLLHQVGLLVSAQGTIDLIFHNEPQWWASVSNSKDDDRSLNQCRKFSTVIRPPWSCSYHVWDNSTHRHQYCLNFLFRTVTYYKLRWLEKYTTCSWERSRANHDYLLFSDKLCIFGFNRFLQLD